LRAATPLDGAQASRVPAGGAPCRGASACGQSHAPWRDSWPKGIGRLQVRGLLGGSTRLGGASAAAPPFPELLLLWLRLGVAALLAPPAVLVPVAGLLAPPCSGTCGIRPALRSAIWLLLPEPATPPAVTGRGAARLTQEATVIRGSDGAVVPGTYDQRFARSFPRSRLPGAVTLGRRPSLCTPAIPASVFVADLDWRPSGGRRTVSTAHVSSVAARGRMSDVSDAGGLTVTSGRPRLGEPPTTSSTRFQ
jgi:hypothetical protein